MRMTANDTRTLIDLLRDRAAAQPDDRAYSFLEDGERPRGSLTWAQLEHRSRAIAAALTRHTAPGERVLVMFPPSVDFVPAFFATLYAGAIAVPVYPPTGARADRTAVRLRGMIADAGVTLVLAPSVVTARAAALAAVIPELTSLVWLDPATICDDEADAWRAPGSTAASLAFLQYTSGSTSRPRGVIVTHANLMHNLAHTEADARYSRDSISLSWLPVNHDMGLINGVLQPVYSGCPAWLMSPSAFLQRPARWLQAVSRLGATHSGGPNFAYDLCTRRVTEDDCAGLDLSSWQVAYNGSEPVRRSTLERFQQTFGVHGFRWEAFSPAYGLAESTLLVASVPAGAPPAFAGNAVASGLTAAIRGVRIVDPVTRMHCADGVAGEIWVRSESVAAGYWNRPEDTRETFRAVTAETGEGPFLRTGDIGFIHQDRLFVSGRIKDIIIIRGLKHYPQDIELTAERAHPALRAGGCAAFATSETSRLATADPALGCGVHEQEDEERLAIVAELDPREHTRADRLELSQVIAAVRVAVAATHHVSPSCVTLVAPGTVPKTTSGKIQRYLCREALGSGSLEARASWTDAAERFDRAAS